MATRRGKNGVRFVDKDRGWGRLRRELRKSLRKPHVVVGIYGNRAFAAHDEAPFTVGGLASIHEFGLGNSPERSFIRGTVDAKANSIRNFARRMARQVVGGRIDTRGALGSLGAFVEGLIIKRINAGIPPANKPATIRRKGSSKPLIDKGQLKGSIAWEVRNA